MLIAGALIARPSLIVCGHLNFAPVAFLIHRLTGIPYWICVYGADAWDIQARWKKQALVSAEKIISISGYTRDRLIREQALNPERISILPVTFDASRFQIAAKPTYLLERHSLSPEQPIILTVGRMSSAEQHKGYDRLIQSLPDIIQAVPNVHYLIVGQGDDRPRVEQLIQRLNLQRYVTLTGFIPDRELGDYYNLCNLFAMPSIAEGFGIVYLEALACGKPTLGGDRDGAIDALCHGELGVLVDPYDVSAIAKAVIQVLQGTYPNPAIYQPDVLRHRVMETYGIERFKQTLTEYLVEFKDMNNESLVVDNCQ
jgi:glycosyltransferase involved in cell wall biosynthesis